MLRPPCSDPLSATPATALQVSFEYDFTGLNTAFEVIWAVLITLSDLVFIVDIGVHFWTAVDKDGELVQDTDRIARGYLRRWFVVDFTAVITGLGRFAVSSTNVVLTTLRICKGLRLFTVKAWLGAGSGTDDDKNGDINHHVCRLCMLRLVVECRRSCHRGSRCRARPATPSSCSCPGAAAASAAM